MKPPIKDVVKFRLEYGPVDGDTARQAYKNAEAWAECRMVFWIICAVSITICVGTALSGHHAASASMLMACVCSLLFVRTANKNIKHYNLVEAVFDQRDYLNKTLKGIE